MTRSDPGTGSSSASDDEVYLATSAIQLHELLMRRSDDSLETVEQNALEALLSDPEVVSRYNAEVKAVMSELFGADRERWPAFRSDVTALPAIKLTVVHEAPVGDEGAVSVLREGHGEDVEGFVFVERNEDAAWVVLHENLGLHFEKAGVDVHDQSAADLGRGTAHQDARPGLAGCGDLVTAGRLVLPRPPDPRVPAHAVDQRPERPRGCACAATGHGSPLRGGRPRRSELRIRGCRLAAAENTGG